MKVACHARENQNIVSRLLSGKFQAGSFILIFGFSQFANLLIKGDSTSKILLIIPIKKPVTAIIPIGYKNNGNHATSPYSHSEKLTW